MSLDKIIKTIDELYEKYGVERIFYSDMETEQIIIRKVVTKIRN